jgi:NTE family protein
MNKTCYRYSVLDLFTALTVTLLLSGCAAYNRVHNAPTTETVAFERLDLGREADESGDIWLFLAFSGGGARAAAFCYGVLEELRETQYSRNGSERRLLDEVDISSAGLPVGSRSGVKLAYVGSRTSEDVGKDADSLGLAYSIRF